MLTCAREVLSRALIVVVALSFPCLAGCGSGQSAEVKKELKNTPVSDDAKNLQRDISSKRKAERDLGKEKAKGAAGQTAPAGADK